MRLSALALALGLTALGAPVIAQTQDSPWDSTDPDELVPLIERAAVSGSATAARNISNVLLRGVSPRVAATALDGLAALARPEGADAVARFLEHRRPMLRRHAVAAAGAIRTRPLVRALEVRLGDPDGDVRAEAAAVLGDVGDRESVRPLWAALDRDLEATLRAEGGTLGHHSAVAIARLGTPEDLERLLGYLQRAPFRTMSDALQMGLSRNDVPDRLKLAVVNAVAGLATPEARDFLETYVRASRGRTPPVDAARAAMTRIGGVRQP